MREHSTIFCRHCVSLLRPPFRYRLSPFPRVCVRFFARSSLLLFSFHRVHFFDWFSVATAISFISDSHALAAYIQQNVRIIQQHVLMYAQFLCVCAPVSIVSVVGDTRPKLIWHILLHLVGQLSLIVFSGDIFFVRLKLCLCVCVWSLIFECYYLVMLSVTIANEMENASRMITSEEDKMHTHIKSKALDKRSDCIANLFA